VIQIKDEFKLEKFKFLIGNWNLEYKIPKSSYSEEATGKGEGTFRRILNDKYVVFDYEASFSTGNKAAAHAIFVRDEKINMFRYWWFEDSGSFMTATCNFLNDETLFLNWHNSLPIQTFKKIDEKTVKLRMENPDKEGKFELILVVIFTRK
jgi:hypothetical protein